MKRCVFTAMCCSILVVLAIAGVPAATAGRRPVATPVGAATNCPVTHPNGSTPPGQLPSSLHDGNGKLWTDLWPAGMALVPRQDVRSDGSMEVKFPWWRGSGVRWPLTITGRRLDAPAPPATAYLPGGYEAMNFQASGVIFPSAGCWEVTGQAVGAKLTFVTLVITVAYEPGVCATPSATSQAADGNALSGRTAAKAAAVPVASHGVARQSRFTEGATSASFSTAQQ